VDDTLGDLVLRLRVLAVSVRILAMFRTQPVCESEAGEAGHEVELSLAAEVGDVRCVCEFDHGRAGNDPWGDMGVIDLPCILLLVSCALEGRNGLAHQGDFEFIFKQNHIGPDSRRQWRDSTCLGDTAVLGCTPPAGWHWCGGERKCGEEGRGAVVDVDNVSSFIYVLAKYLMTDSCG
jgi:hypothetical protein